MSTNNYEGDTSLSILTITFNHGISGYYAAVFANLVVSHMNQQMELATYLRKGEFRLIGNEKLEDEKAGTYGPRTILYIGCPLGFGDGDQRFQALGFLTRFFDYLPCYISEGYPVAPADGKQIIEKTENYHPLLTAPYKLMLKQRDNIIAIEMEFDVSRNRKTAPVAEANGAESRPEAIGENQVAIDALQAEHDRIVVDLIRSHQQEMAIVLKRLERLESNKKNFSAS